MANLIQPINYPMQYHEQGIEPKTSRARCRNSNYCAYITMTCQASIALPESITQCNISNKELNPRPLVPDVGLKKTHCASIMTCQASTALSESITKCNISNRELNPRPLVPVVGIQTTMPTLP